MTCWGLPEPALLPEKREEDTASDKAVAGTHRRQAGIATLSGSGPIHEIEFDLVIVVDAIRSATRKLVLGDMEVGIIDTGWGI